METDLDLVLQSMNATSTDDRRSGIGKFLEAIKGFYHFDINESNANNLRNFFYIPTKVSELFMAISRLLRDPDWKIRRDTFEILIAIITKEMLKENLDSHMSGIIKHLVNCLSDSMMTVRKSATQCLHEYLNRTKNFEKIMKDFVEYGLNKTLNKSQRQDNNQALQVVLTSNFANHDFSDLIIGILKQLEIDTDDDKIDGIVIGMLKAIKKLVGDDQFFEYTHNLPENILPLFSRCSTSLESQSHNTTPSPWNVNGTSNSSFASSSFQSKKFPSLAAPVNETVYFGFIPQSVIDDIKNDRKLEAIESIYNLFKISYEKEMKSILSHLPELLVLIQKLMEDKYLVIMTAYKLLIDIVSSIPASFVNVHLDMLLQLLRLALAHNMNADAIIQKYTMAYSMILIQKADTRELLEKLCDSQFMSDNKQASIRQTSIDIIISALLKFPSTKFDLDFLSAKVAQRLLDKKQKVKQAALECISVIGYNYGNGKISTLLKTVEQATKGDTSNNISELVQARLSKHRLPHVDDLGIVIYVTDTDKVSNQRQQSIIDLENSSSDNSPISSANPLEKRRPSAGKVRGRAKFPWDQNEGNINKSIPLSKAPGLTSLNQIQPSDSIPILFSEGPLSITSKELMNEGRTIRKLNELHSNSMNDSDRVSSKSQPVTGRSMSTENNSLISMHTSGYSSGSTTFRQNNDYSSKITKESSTATNSTSVTPRNNYTTSRYEESTIETAHIPTKPALGRSAGSRRRESEVLNSNRIDNDKNLNENSHENDDLIESVNSPMLQAVRNSASKKKALKLFNSSNQSTGSNNGSELELNGSSSINSPSSYIKIQQENSNSQKKDESPNIYNPQKGATFKSNPQYSALVIGKGVAGPPIESNDIQPFRKKQPVKGMLETSNIGSVSQRSMVGNSHNDTKKYVRSDYQIVHPTYGHSESPSNGKNILRNSVIGQTVPDLNNGIVGIGLADKSSLEDDSDEEPNKTMMSNTLRESLSLKRQKVASELHSNKTDVNINPPALASYSAPGSGSHQAAHRKPPAAGYYYTNNLPASAGNEREITNGYETVPPSRKPLRPPSFGNSTPKKIKSSSQIVSNVQTYAAAESMPINPAPLNNPERQINECLTLIQNEDWENKISAMIIMHSLVQFHTEMLLGRTQDIHAICIALCKECKNLRSQVAKCAIQTVGQLFIYLKKYMDSVLENIVSNLLSKAGEGTNSFLKQDVDTTLTLMIENVTPQRAFISLLQSGADHKNPAIRRVTAYNIMQLCDKLGPMKTISCIKEIPDKILPGIVKFAMDGSQETRYYGKKILSELNKQSDFEKIYTKHIQAKDLRILKDILDNIKLKGIGDPPQSSHSAGIQRSGSLSRGGSAGNLVALGSKSSPLSRGSSRSMTRLPGSDLSDDDKDWLMKTCSQLSSSDFRNRQNGLESLLNKVELNGLQIPQKSISKLLKEFIPRLNDNNTKVTVTALYICQRIIPFICSIFPTEFFPEFINTIALNFASKSTELRDAASSVMDVCFANLDHSLLIQPCIEAINKSNSKTKPILIDKINDLLSAIKVSKPSALNRSAGMIIRHLIPEIGLLLEKNRPLTLQLKESIHNLVVLSHDIVGQEMIDSAAQRGDHTLKQSIIDILHMKNEFNSH